MSDHTIVVISVIKTFFVQFFCVFLLPLLNIFGPQWLLESQVAGQCPLCDTLHFAYILCHWWAVGCPVWG